MFLPYRKKEKSVKIRVGWMCQYVSFLTLSIKVQIVLSYNLKWTDAIKIPSQYKMNKICSEKSMLIPKKVRPHALQISLHFSKLAKCVLLAL